MTVNRLAAVGAFVIVGALLFGLGLFLIGDRRTLFGDTFRIHAAFASIGGLDNGATVRVGGLDAGEVESIQVPNRPSEPFRVRMRIRGDLRQLIRLDSVATIQNDGLVGNKFVQIEPGTDESPVAPDQGTIASREPFDLANVLERMSGTIDTVNETILDVKREIDEALTVLSDTAVTAQTLMNDVGKDARSIMASANRVTDDVQAIVAGVRGGRGTIGQLVNDDALYQRAKAIGAEAEQAMVNVRAATAEVKSVLAEFRSGDSPVTGLAGSLQQTLAEARDVMAGLAESTEALKRNFFLRGFFNRRGYFDLDDVSVDDYRQGVLVGQDRKALRIWVKADLLFDRDSKGTLTLTSQGRARLDSAMSQFVQYPKTSPFVVEGYAQAPTADERYLVSRARAQLVSDYVVGKYGLDSNSTTTMAMGAEAQDSPTGDSWDGIALAMFVRK